MQMQQQQMQQQQKQQQQMQSENNNSDQKIDPGDELTQVVVQQQDGTSKQLSTAEVVQILEEQQNKINELFKIIEEKDSHIKRLELVSR